MDSAPQDDDFELEFGPLDPTVQNLVDQDTLRWLFVGGKGGVGKTTCSCAIAARLARSRESVLLISTDPAHNLSDAFNQKFSGEPTLVKSFSNLYAMEIDANAVSVSLSGGADSSGAGMQGWIRDLSSSIPGIDEAVSFAEVMKRVKKMDHSVVVFDTAPTGHTLRLLQMPGTMGSALAKFSELQARFGGILGQVGSMLGMGGFDAAEIGERLASMQSTIEEVSGQFRDPECTSFVCVMIPEFLSLYGKPIIFCPIQWNPIRCSPAQRRTKKRNVSSKSSQRWKWMSGT